MRTAAISSTIACCSMTGTGNLRATSFGLYCHFDEVMHADYYADFDRYNIYFADHQDLIVWKLTYG